MHTGKEMTFSLPAAERCGHANNTHTQQLSVVHPVGVCLLPLLIIIVVKPHNHYHH
jgi:hypothetical protein